MFRSDAKLIQNKALLFNKKNSANLLIKNKVDYAIISAMPEEFAFVIDKFSELDYVNTKIGEFNFRIYDYQNAKVLITHTGMGTAFAASMLTLIQQSFQPDYVLVSGTAGGINENLNIGDVVVAEKAFEAEMQDVFTVLKGTPFESCLVHPVKKESFPAQYLASLDLINLCESLDIKDINIHKGAVVSSNAFPAPKELFEKIKDLKPLTIDMETSALYQTAWLLNIKVLAFRGVSNLLNAEGTDENVHRSDVKGSSMAAARVLLAVLDQSIALKNKIKPQDKLEEEIAQLRNDLGLLSHPEGGYFSQVFKSNDTVKPADSDRYHDEMRSAGTSIYYLLDREKYSAWHILQSDELWYYHKGSTLKIHIIDEDGNLNTHLLGDSLENKEAKFQVTVKAGNYFSAELVDKEHYAVVSCSVFPGYEDNDFRLANKNELLSQYPQHQELIERLSIANAPAVEQVSEEQNNVEMRRTFR